MFWGQIKVLFFEQNMMAPNTAQKMHIQEGDMNYKLDQSLLCVGILGFNLI